MATPLPEPSTSNPLRLLLAGRRGNGKSSTGNSILGGKKFISTGSSKNDILMPTSAKEILRGKTVTVVDGVEIDDCSDDVKITRSMAGEAFSLCPDGFSALLIFLKYGVRFTKQEQDAIKMIKSVFGEDIVQSHGIVVMTHGDNFDRDFEDEEMRLNFDDWCREQFGNIKFLYEETSGRWVLFDNKTKDKEKIKNQVTTLLSLAEKIQISSGSFRGREPPPSETTAIQIEPTEKTTDSNVKAGEKDFSQDNESNQNIAGGDISVQPDAEGNEQRFSWWSLLEYVLAIFGVSSFVKSHAYKDSDKKGEAETIIKEIIQTLQEIDDKTHQRMDEELERLQFIKNRVADIENQHEKSGDIDKLRSEISHLKSRIDSSIRLRQTIRDHAVPKTEKLEDATLSQGSDLEDIQTASDLSIKVDVEQDPKSCTVQETTHCVDGEKRNLKEILFDQKDVKIKEDNQQEMNSTKKMKVEQEGDVQNQCEKIAHQQVDPGFHFDSRARQEVNGSSYCEAGDQNQTQRIGNCMSLGVDAMEDGNANNSSLEYQSFDIIEHADCN